MKRKLLSIVLALCLTLTLLPTMSVAAGSYADTNGHWAETSIERWSSYGILQGSEGKFAPDGTLTRAQMATILSRLLNLPAAESVGFTDVPAGEWYADAINRCAAAGILQGTDGKANPNAPITREQAMVMLCRALGIEALSGADLSGYPDGAQVSPYAQGYVAALVRTGIVKGDVNGKLNPAGVITRAEIVTIVDRMVTVYANADGAAVSAANGGTVLVVAKNVKVENAPEGTKIIAGKDASGLSVNGKAVSAGQTYIVPAAAETKPSTSGNVIEVPPHAHVYTYVDNGNGKHTATCYAGDVTFTEAHTIVDGKCTLCGAAQTVDSAASVKKSDGTHAYYPTLADAINAADAGDTITLVEKSSENFVVPSGKDITLDLNGYEITTSEQPKIEEGGSLTIRGEGGSIILEKRGIYLEGSLTLESGKIESKEHSDVIFIMGNGNFTMTGGMLLADAGACIDASYLTSGVSRLNITGGVVETKDPAVNAIYINSRWGRGKIELTISGGTIKAAKRAAIALDASDSVSTISLTGGTFSSDPTAYVAEGYIAYQKDDSTYQVVKNAGTVNVSLSELNKIAITKGPKTTGEKEKTSFTVDLGSETVAASDIAYSEHSTGYTGKGVQIGSSSLNSYAATPANAGDYEFVIKGGTINSAVTGYESIDGLTNTSVYMLVPGNSDVVFEGVTFNGVFSFDVQMYTSPWSYLNSITFKNCTFNGIIVGSCPAKEATFEGCVFNSYTNTTKANNSNPIWWRAATGYWGEGSDESVHSLEKFTFVGNRVFGTRPVKIERIGWNCTASITILNNYFDISAQAGDTSTKNMAINIGQKDNTSKFILIDDGNRISNNTASLYTAALGSGSNQYIAVSGTQVLDSKDNEKVINVMVWKTTTGETFEMKTIQ